MRTRQVRELAKLNGGVAEVRRTWPCSRKGCGRPGALRPILLFVPSRDFAGPPFRLGLPKVFCAKHAEPRANVLLDDEVWGWVVDYCAKFGKAVPYRQGTRVEYVRQGNDP